MENGFTPPSFRLSKTDTVSSVAVKPPSILPNSYIVSATDWSGTLEVHSLPSPPDSPSSAFKYHHPCPLLSHVWEPTPGQPRLYFGAVDGGLFAMDLSTSKSSELGRHDEGVSCMAELPQRGAIMTASWDRSVGYWDGRMGKAYARLEVGERVYALDTAEPLAVVGVANRGIKIIDVRKPDVLFDSRWANLKFQIRDVAAFPDSMGYVAVSISGHVSVEHVQPTASSKNLTFNVLDRTRHLNRSNVLVNQQGTEAGAIVNCVTFGEDQDVFITGGSDGAIHYWDRRTGKLLAGSASVDRCVVAMSCVGDVLAYGCGYDWGKGAAARPADENPYLGVRQVAKMWTGNRRAGNEMDGGWKEGTKDHWGYKSRARGRGRGRGRNRGRRGRSPFGGA